MGRITSLKEEDIRRAKSLKFALFAFMNGSPRRAINLNFNNNHKDNSNLLDQLKHYFKSENFYAYVTKSVELMSRFPESWIETDLGKFFQVDSHGRINQRDRLWGWTVNNREQQSYIIDPIYLRAIPTYLQQFSGTSLNYEDLIRRYPIVGTDIHRVGGSNDGSELPNRILYTMDLIEGKLKWQNPRYAASSGNPLTQILHDHPQLRTLSEKASA